MSTGSRWIFSFGLLALIIPASFCSKYTIKANPSPNGNGFAFNLFGDLDNTRVEPKDWDMWRYFGVFKTDCSLYARKG